MDEVTYSLSDPRETAEDCCDGDNHILNLKSTYYCAIYNIIYYSYKITIHKIFCT